MTDTTFSLKIDKYGDVKWTSVNGTGYALVGEGTTRRVLVDSADLVRVERPYDEPQAKGWDVVVFNEKVGPTYRTKREAQDEALSYLR